VKDNLVYTPDFCNKTSLYCTYCISLLEKYDLHHFIILLQTGVSVHKFQLPAEHFRHSRPIPVKHN